MLKQAELRCSSRSSLPSAQRSQPGLVHSKRYVRCSCTSKQVSALTAPVACAGFQQAVPQRQQQQHQQQQQQQDASSISRREAFLQLSSVATFGSLSMFLSGTTLQLAIPSPAAAAAGPQLLDGEVRAAVLTALSKVVTKPKGPVLLRLAYHDAATYSKATGDGGANASIQYELDRPENTGLKRGWGVINQIQNNLKGTPAQGRLSNADLIALAGAYAVQICGGPSINVPIGRLDAPQADPTGRMVSEKAGIDALISNFADKGLGIQELVVLSGAHTLGGKGFGDPVTFDNAYYTALLAKPWLNPKDEMASMIGLPSDHVLPDDPDCLRYIQAYADDQQLFFRDFAKAYGQLTSLGAVWA